MSVGSVFENLTPSVVTKLERHHWDSLYRASREHVRGPLGENATKDFILKQVFDLDPVNLKTEADLLHLLLHKHFGARLFPAFLDDRLVQLLRQQPRWQEWPLDALVPDRSAFFAFLQERWPLFLLRRIGAADDRVAESEEPYSTKYPGPADIPFDSEKVRVYIDDLFVEGFLKPAKVAGPRTAVEPWMEFGIASETAEGASVRLEKLLDTLAASIPPASAPHVDWVRAASRWAEATALRWSSEASLRPETLDKFTTIQQSIDLAFGKWLVEHYGSLYSLGCLPHPVMVHHIPQAMAHGLSSASGNSGAARRALVLVDGLALSQWAVLRQGLISDTGLLVDESAAFAWIPTLTCVSRQAVFSGQPPLLFGGSIDQTQKDEAHWSRFWEDNGVRRSEVTFLLQKEGETDEALRTRVAEAAQRPRVRVLGMVVSTVDRMVHGAATGAGGLHAQVRHWAEGSHLKSLVSCLLEAGFEVYLTSDHGNVEAVGAGKPNVGVVASEKGERVHVFPDELTRANVARDFPSSWTWLPVGLPDGYYPLLSSGRSAFLADGKRTLAHGGASLEEVMVPFAIIRRRA